jgi:hypothetical protein
LKRSSGSAPSSSVFGTSTVSELSSIPTSRQSFNPTYCPSTSSKPLVVSVDQVEFSRPHLVEMLGHDMRDGVPLRLLFEVAPDPGAFRPGQQCIDARLTFRQRSIVQIGRIVYAESITGGVYLDGACAHLA